MKFRPISNFSLRPASRRVLILSILILLLIIGTGSYFFIFNKRIEVIHPVYGPAIRAVYATGTVEASVMMPIASRVSARLIELNADEGTQVKKGQILAQLEAHELQQTLKELEAREKFNKNRLDRSSKLLKQAHISKQEYESDLSDWLASKAAVNAVKAQISYLQLLAPADGYIIKRDGEIGELIPANQPVFWLTCCAPLRITAEVDEEDIAQVQPGQSVLIRSDAFPTQTFYGTVQSITPKGNPIARSYRVRIAFNNKTPFMIGMTTENNIITYQNKHALLLPASTILHGKIWLVKNGVIKQIMAQIGVQDEKQVEILSGITTDDLVVLHPNEKLKNNERINAHLVQQVKE